MTDQRTELLEPIRQQILWLCNFTQIPEIPKFCANVERLVAEFDRAKKRVKELEGACSWDGM